ncbi:MAG: PqqD family protein [Methanoregula sp.]|nr:PqqD family protein [Methanoregula sp.]
MAATIISDSVFQRSEDVVTREIMGELILVPLTSGIGDMEDEIYTFNETGRAIWELLDGRKSVREIARELEALYESPDGEIERDVQGIIAELIRRRMIFVV